MPSHQSAVSTLIREVLADPDLAHDEVFRRLLQAGLQDLVDAEAAAVIGAQRYERTPERTNRRNGKRLKTVATTAGEVELAIPKLRTGSFFPSLLHPRRRVDKARMRRDLPGVDRGRVHAQGLATSSRPWATSRASAAPRSQGSARTSTRGSRSSSPGRWITPGSPTCSPGATYLDVRVGHRVVCRALVVATGVSAEGRREILGMALGDAETVDFWTSLSCGPCESGGSRSPPRRIPPGSCWSPVTRTPASGPRSGRSFPGRPGSAAGSTSPATSPPGSVRPAPEPAGALVSTIFAQTSQEAVAAQYKHVIDALRDPFPSESPGC